MSIKNLKMIFKDEEAYYETFVKELNTKVNVKIYDFAKGDQLTEFALKSLSQIQKLDQSIIVQMKSDFWRFAKNCMKCSNYGPDADILAVGETQLERSMKNLNIFNQDEAFDRCNLKFAHTSNNGYGGFVNGIASVFDLWFETPWDSNFTVVEFENGAIKDYSFC